MFLVFFNLRYITCLSVARSVLVFAWLKDTVAAAFSCVRLLSIAMEVVPAQEAETALHTCKLCGKQHPLSEGRIHGKAFSCWTCQNIQQTIRRNLGSTSTLTEWTVQETHDFFRKVQTAKSEHDGKMQWQTVRSQLVKTMTERQISRFESTAKIEMLPKSVYMTRGWKEATLDKFPTEWSDEYGDNVVKMPVRSLKWAEVFESVNEKLLQLEKEAAAKKGKKAENDLDLPAASGSGEAADDAKKAERSKAAAAKKTAVNNERIAAVAGKALGPLMSMETCLEKLLAKPDTAAHAAPESVKVCQDTLLTVSKWKLEAREAVNALEHGKGVDEPPSLPALSFDMADVKVLVKQGSEGQKAVRQALPKRVPKAKAAPPAKAEGTEEDERKPKRRRGKCPE